MLLGRNYLQHGDKMSLQKNSEKYKKLLEELRSMKRIQDDKGMIVVWRDAEEDHGRADDILLELLNDPEVTEAFNEIEKWYA